MKSAKDRIIFPMDVPGRRQARRYADLLAGAVGMFKVGLELFMHAGPEVLRTIHDRGEADIFLDLKLHDIPATVERAMAAIAALEVRFATVHCGENPRMLEAAVAGSRGKVAVLGVTVLTSVSAADLKGAGYREEFSRDLTALVLQRARDAKAAGCAGVVCSGREAALIKADLGRGFLTVTPGIRPLWAAGRGDDQCRRTTPAEAIAGGSDYLVVGRPIRDAEDPRAAAIRVAEEIEAAQRTTAAGKRPGTGPPPG